MNKHGHAVDRAKKRVSWSGSSVAWISSILGEYFIAKCYVYYYYYYGHRNRHRHDHIHRNKEKEEDKEEIKVNSTTSYF